MPLRQGLVRLFGWTVLVLAGAGPTSPVAAQGTTPATAPGGTSGAARFPVLAYRIEGNSVLSADAVAEVVFPHVGTGRTEADVEVARGALEKAYGDAGYPTVTVELPQQSVNSGIVVLRVVERPVGRLRVTGARYFMPSQVRAGAPSVAEGVVPRLPDIQRDIVALNTLPDRRVSPSLNPGRAPNTVDVDLQVEDTPPFHGSLEINNRQSRNTRELRLGAALRYDNLFGRGDSVAINYTVAPERKSDAEVYSGSYLFRIPGSVASVQASYLRSNSNVATVGATNVIGRGNVFGLRGIVPLAGSPSFNHSASVGVDRKKFDENLNIGFDQATSAVNSLRVPIEYYPFVASYSGSLVGERSTTDFSTGLTWTFRGLGSDTTEYEFKRAYANPTWTHLRAALTHLHRFENDVQLYLNSDAQWSPDSLISNEQFAAGGLDSVRGYFEVETLGDYGISTQLEARSPSLAPRLGAPFDDLRFHVFLDGATTAIHRPLPEQQRGQSLLSTGGGVRMRVYQRISGSAEGAVALTNGVDTRTGSARALFRLFGEF